MKLRIIVMDPSLHCSQPQGLNPELRFLWFLSCCTWQYFHYPCSINFVV